MEKKSIESPSPSEESGWSMYIADFIATHSPELEDQDQEQGLASMASGAASGGPCKNSSGFGKLRFGRRKARDHHHPAVLDDDDLEDTASSPVNSPKVSDHILYGSELMDAKMKLSDDGKQIIYKEGDRIDGYNLNSREEVKKNNSEEFSTELSRRGLCLVPTSMIIDYLKH